MDTIGKRVSSVILVCAACCAMLCGCVKRTETIKVERDGSIRWKIEVEGDKEDMEQGAPSLARAPGWEFEETSQTDKDGKTKIERKARVTIPADEEFPHTYPTEDAEGEALAMRQTTAVTIERRADGLYYHFRRVYEPRQSAYVDVWWNEFYEEYRDKDPADMDDKEALKFVRKLGEISQRKHVALIRAASLSLDERWPQEVLLAVYKAATDVIDAVDPEDVVKLLKESDEDDDSGLDALGERVEQEILDATGQVLVRAGYNARQIERFQQLLERERRRYEITEDYYDDAWEVRLELPGRIVGHNGDSVNGDRITWERKGEHFYDREVEMMATSVVLETE